MGSKSYELLSAFSRTLPDDIQTELNEYQKRVQLIVDKSDQQYNTYLQQLTSSQEKNIDLSSQFSKMKNEEAKLMEQLNE